MKTGENEVPNNKQILEALKASGYLFEHEIASKFESLGFHVETSWPYLDKESKKSREIDLKAIKCLLHDPENAIQVFVEFLVECKDANTPFLFFERPKNKRELGNRECKSYIFPRKSFKDVIKGDEPKLNISEYRETKHYYFNDPMKATQFAKIVNKGGNWTANHDGIYDSIFIPLAKAVESRIAQIPRNTANKLIWLLFPVVVLRDRLLTYRVDHEGEIQKKGRVTFVRNMESEELKGDYMIDFVTSGYLDKYIEEEVFLFSESIVKLVSEKLKA